jgi:ankyrin repeat protein
MARLLLEFGSPPDVPDSQGRTPLFFAVIGNAEDVARLILSFGVSRSDVVPPETGLGMYEIARMFGLFDKLFA